MISLIKLLVMICTIVLNIHAPAPKEIPALAITTSTGESIQYISAPNVWGGAVYDRMDTFSIYENELGQTVPVTVNASDSITIGFEGVAAPQSYALYEYPVNLAKDKRLIEASEGIGEITFSPQQLPASVRDNGTETREQHTRAYLLTCSWGNDYQCEYLFYIIYAE